jgi:hypothetical protein
MSGLGFFIQRSAGSIPHIRIEDRVRGDRGDEFVWLSCSSWLDWGAADNEAREIQYLENALDCPQLRAHLRLVYFGASSNSSRARIPLKNGQF